MEDISKELGRRIREYRRINGLTQEQLANQLGICSRSVIALERGTGNPRLDILQKITRNLGISLDSLLMEQKPSGNSKYRQLVQELSLCTETGIELIYPVVHQLILVLGSWDPKQ
ncbi:MAG: helix-turn-helix transcriptional regulator [Eubacteriales bacterium]|nr:helix-turn-helix transcriptional regulator [Eubacteriales bacterium]